jgi:hypothetical protein
LGATADDLESATVTLIGDAFVLNIEIADEAFIQATCTYVSADISFPVDGQNYALLSDAGTGIYVSKSASSRIITVKNRLGSSKAIRVTTSCGITSATAWA